MPYKNFLPAPIKYQLKGNFANPFDIYAVELFFFYDGAYSCIVDNMNCLNEFHNASDRYVVFNMKRLDIVNMGSVLKHFSNPPSSTLPLEKDNPHFIILSNQPITYYFTNNGEIVSIMAFEVTRPNCAYGGLHSLLWNDYEACLNYAVKFSLESENTLLVVQCVTIHDRH